MAQVARRYLSTSLQIDSVARKAPSLRAQHLGIRQPLPAQGVQRRVCKFDSQGRVGACRPLNILWIVILDIIDGDLALADTVLAFWAMIGKRVDVPNFNSTPAAAEDHGSIVDERERTPLH